MGPEDPKEHGLLFKPDMVRAYLDGRKIQTRRVITRQNSYIDGGPAHKRIWDELQFDKAWIDQGPSPAGNIGPYLQVPRVEIENGKVVDKYVHRVYPRYQVGDTIWGRETWCPLDREGWHDSTEPRDKILTGSDGRPRLNGVAHKASCTDPEGERCRIELGYKWKPSIHMPRWAARIVTPILASGPERLREITPADAKEEGATELSGMPSYYEYGAQAYVRWFRGLWNDINRDRGYGFDDDSWHGWVWAIRFQRHSEET